MLVILGSAELVKLFDTLLGRVNNQRDSLLVSSGDESEVVRTRAQPSDALAFVLT